MLATDVEGDAGARITGRRIPASTELHWTVTFDRGLDPTDPGCERPPTASWRACGSGTAPDPLARSRFLAAAGRLIT